MTQQSTTPLAARMRPKTKDDLVGQESILTPGSPLDRLMNPDSTNPPSVILWGNAGTGKTTIAHLIAELSGREFVELSAVSAGVKDVRAVIDAAKKRLEQDGSQTVLFIDEVHRFSKSQQDILLPAVEHGDIIFVAATTENPSFSVVGPLQSRSLVLQLNELDEKDLKEVLSRALNHPDGLNNQFTITDETLDHIVRLSNFDARHALTLLEAASGTAQANHPPKSKKPAVITNDDVSLAAQQNLATWNDDDHYDVISAFIKSIRGSDPQAAMHYLARMLYSGEDPRFIARRLVIHASEDIGLADNTPLLVATAAQSAVEKIGMPEAQITLAHATIVLATAPKSPAVINAINMAMDDAKNGKTGSVPLHLRDAHYKTAKKYGHGVGYQYPHDYPFSLVKQQYLPDSMIGTEYYQPSDNGNEVTVKKRMLAVDQYLNQ